MCEGKPCFVRNTFVFPSALVLGSTASSRVRFFRFFFVPRVLPLFLRTYICWMSVRRSGTSASLCQVRHAVALIAPRGVGHARAAPGRGKREIRREKGSLPQGWEREGGPFPFGNGRGKQAPRRGKWREKGVRFTVEWVAGKRDPFVSGSRGKGIPMPGPWGDGNETPSSRGWSGSGGGGRNPGRGPGRGFEPPLVRKLPTRGQISHPPSNHPDLPQGSFSRGSWITNRQNKDSRSSVHANCSIRSVSIPTGWNRHREMNTPPQHGSDQGDYMPLTSAQEQGHPCWTEMDRRYPRFPVGPRKNQSAHSHHKIV